MEEQNQQQNAQPQQPTGSQPVGADNKDIQENKAVAFLSYIGILCLVPLLAKKDSKFCQFHGKQGLVLLIMEIIGMVTIPVLGLGFLVNLAAFILSIIGIINVSNGSMKKVPVIGDFADKFNL